MKTDAYLLLFNVLISNYKINLFCPCASALVFVTFFATHNRMSIVWRMQKKTETSELFTALQSYRVLGKLFL